MCVQLPNYLHPAHITCCLSSSASRRTSAYAKAAQMQHTAINNRNTLPLTLHWSICSVGRSVQCGTPTKIKRSYAHTCGHPYWRTTPQMRYVTYIMSHCSQLFCPLCLSYCSASKRTQKDVFNVKHCLLVRTSNSFRDPIP